MYTSNSKSISDTITIELNGCYPSETGPDYKLNFGINISGGQFLNSFNETQNIICPYISGSYNPNTIGGTATLTISGGCFLTINMDRIQNYSSENSFTDSCYCEFTNKIKIKIDDTTINLNIIITEG